MLSVGLKLVQGASMQCFQSLGLVLTVSLVSRFNLIPKHDVLLWSPLRIMCL